MFFPSVLVLGFGGETMTLSLEIPGKLLHELHAPAPPWDPVLMLLIPTVKWSLISPHKFDRFRVHEDCSKF